MSIRRYAPINHTHASAGGGATELSGLSDVNTSTPTNKNFLIADGVDWESRALVVADVSDFTDSSTNWNTAYGWGDHASGGYLTSETSHADVVVDGDFSSNGILKRTAAGVYGIVTDNSANWDTAYGWGDHASGGYLTAVSEANVETALSAALAFTANNYVFNVDQTVGAGQDNYVLTYDNSSGEIGLEAAAGGSGPTIETGTVENQVLRWDVANAQWEATSYVKIQDSFTPPAGSGHITFGATASSNERQANIWAPAVSTGSTMYCVEHQTNDSGFYNRTLGGNNPATHMWGSYESLVDTDLFGIVEGNEFRVTAGATFLIGEKAAAGSDRAAWGQIWVQTATPNHLMFTDDAGTDQRIDPSHSEISGKTANYTLVLGDKGKTIRFTGATAAQTITIPANSSVAFPVGTMIGVTNDGSVSISLAITTDTLTWSKDNTTGTRTLAAGADCVIHKVASTSWKIGGSALVT